MKKTVIVRPTSVNVRPKSRISHGKSVGRTKWKKCDVPWQKPTSEMTVASCRRVDTGAEAADIPSILPNLTRVNRLGPRFRTRLAPQNQIPEETVMLSRTLRALALACLAAASAAALAQTEIKLGHVGEPGSIFQKSADEFARRANAKLGGKAKVVVYGSSQLGGDKEMLQKAKLGTVDMVIPSTVMSSEA